MSGLHDKHRERMDEKASLAGLYNMPDHEVLEMILYAIIPRGNTNEIARRLCDRFGGIANVFRASIKDLEEVEGVGHKTARFLNSMPEVLGIVERSINWPEKKITDREDAREYMKTFFNGKLTEQFYMLSLTKTGNVIATNRLSVGITDEVHIYPRTVVEMALKNGAHSVVIAHNHPGGTTMPSHSDIKFTEEIYDALKILGIKLFESVIVAKGEVQSILDSPICKIV